MTTPRYQSFDERFAALVAANADGCWRWPGTTTRRSRWMYRKLHGSIPAGQCVLHTCDNPLCIRPDHLFLGTHGDNSADMKRKGRQKVGEAKKNAKLKAVDVVRIRRERAAGVPAAVLAAELHVTAGTIEDIAQGRSWQHVKTPTIRSRRGSYVNLMKEE